jgi:WD40 repeat protein
MVASTLVGVAVVFAWLWKDAGRQQLLGLGREGILYLEQGRLAAAKEALLVANKGLSKPLPPRWISLGIWELFRRYPAPLLEYAPPAAGVRFHGPADTAWLSPDGHRFLSIGADGKTELRDVTTGSVLWKIPAGQDSSKLLLSRDESSLVVVDRMGIHVWDVLSAQRRWSTDYPQISNGEGILPPNVDMSADGKQLVVGSIDGNARVYDTKTGRVVFELTTRSVNELAHPQPFHVAFTPDGNWILTEAHPDLQSGLIQLWNRSTGEMVGAFEVSDINGIAVAPNGTAAVVDATTLTLFSLPSGRQQKRILLASGTNQNSTDPVSSVRITDTIVAIRTFFGRIEIYDAREGSKIASWKGDPSPFIAFDIDDSGQHLLTVSMDGSSALWTVQGQQTAPESFKASEGFDIRLDPGSRWVLGVDDHRKVVMRDTATTLSLLTFDLEVGNTYYLTPTGHLFAITPFSGRTDIYRLDPAGSLDVAGHVSRVSWNGRQWDFFPTVGFSDDEHSLIGTFYGGLSESLLGSVDFRSGNVNWAVPYAHEQAVGGIHPGNLLLLGQGGAFRQIRTRDGAVGKQLQITARDSLLTAATLSGNRLVASANQDLVEIDLGSGSVVHSWPSQGQISELATMPQSEIVLSNGGAGLFLQAWDLSEGRSLVNLRVAYGGASPRGFSDDGYEAVVGSEVWRIGRYRSYVEFAETVPAAKRALARNPTDRDALKTLGRWFHFRGDWSWALEFLDRAAKAGADIDPILVGQCAWQLGQWQRADAAFTEYAASANDQSEKWYRQRILEAVRNRGPVRFKPSAPQTGQVSR